MKSKYLNTVAFGIFFAVLTSTLNASFQEASEYVDTDGEFVTYIDFEGDGTAVGSALNAIYTEIITNTPEAIPIPLDFNQLFTHLGFGSIRSMAWSSREIEPGLHKNTTVSLMNGKPQGLFAIYGNEAHTFSAAVKAPADARGAITANIDLTVLRDTAITLANQIMGPMGDGILKQQLAQTIPETDISVNDLIEALSGNIDAFWFESYESGLTDPIFKFWVSFEKAGPLLDRLRLLEEALRITFTEEETALKAKLKLPEESFNLFVEAPKASNELIIYTNADWSANSEGPRLTENPEFKALVEPLPDQGLLFYYTGETDVEPFLEALTSFPQAVRYKNACQLAIDLFVGGFLKPSAGAIYLKDSNFVSEQYGSYSTKQTVMTIPAISMIGIGAGIAIPAFGQVRAHAKESIVANNLRQIASAAQQYFLEHGATEIHVDQLKDYLALPLESVAGESYDLTITSKMDTLSVTLEDGTVISVDL